MNNIFIISGPSGAGEDSIINKLEKLIPLERVTTTTTRPMRSGESEGRPYFFISEKDFKNKIKKNVFFEWAEEYNGNLYGVSKKEINRVKKSGKIGIWKIEYKGVLALKKLFPKIIAILIFAPLPVLKNRIMSRDKNISKKYLQERMKYTKEWMRHKNIYDFIIMNEQGKLNEAVKKVLKIIDKNLPEGFDKK